MGHRQKWVFPRIGGNTPKWMVKIMKKTLLIHGWFGGKTHYFRKHPNILDIAFCASSGFVSGRARRSFNQTALEVQNFPTGSLDGKCWSWQWSSRGVVSNLFDFQPYLGKWWNLTNIIQICWNHQLVMLWSCFFDIWRWQSKVFEPPQTQWIRQKSWNIHDEKITFGSFWHLRIFEPWHYIYCFKDSLLVNTNSKLEFHWLVHCFPKTV